MGGEKRPSVRRSGERKGSRHFDSCHPQTKSAAALLPPRSLNRVRGRGSAQAGPVWGYMCLCIMVLQLRILRPCFHQDLQWRIDFAAMRWCVVVPMV